MRVLVLSWEYPPVVHGGLGRHVAGLADALTTLGHQLTVVAPGPAARSAPPGGPTVVHPDPADPVVPLTVSDLHGHVATLGTALARAAIRAAAAADEPFDVVCAHDWVVGQAAVTVRDALGIPLVVTMHATEAGRHQGWLPGDLSRSIHATEGWLVGHASRVIACSSAMAHDLQRLFPHARDRLSVIPNGIDLGSWPEGDTPDLRGPVLVFAGRLEYEKGVQDLLRAMPRLRRRIPGVQLVVAGSGTYEGELHKLAARLRLGRAVRFAGRLSDAELVELYCSAAAVAVPSLYEPFGLVALEAASCGAPLVVGGVGGLLEFADGGRNAKVVPPEDVAGLADALTDLLRDREQAGKLATAAREVAERHDWRRIAAATADVYAKVRGSRPPALTPLPPPPQDTNLLR